MVSRTAALVACGVLTASAAAAQTCTNDARQVVSAIYRQVLERNAQANEMSNWANRLSGGQVTVREIVQDFAVSAEHRQRFLAGTSDGDRKNAVSNLYKHLLGREPDGGGLHAHMDLAARRGIDVVVSSLI